MFSTLMHPSLKGVRSVSEIPRGTVVGPCPLDFCCQLSAVDILSKGFAIEVQFENGELRRRHTFPSHLPAADNDWLFFVQAARDHQEQNLEFVLHNSQVYIKVTKDVRFGDRLLIWYGFEVSRTLDIPVLSPSNIIANNRYVCTRCKQSYAFPNSLKTHLRLCNHFSQVFAPLPLIWQPWMIQPERMFQYGGIPSEDMKHSLLANNRLPHRFSNVSSTLTKLSALKVPDLAKIINSYKLPTAEDALQMKYFLNNSIEGLKSQTVVTCPQQIVKPNGVVDGNHFETSVRIPPPNEVVGEPLDVLPLYSCRHDKGHICVYCGKLYSRKYGLKIHLRTHTGYKPLKCKVCFRSFGDPSNLNKHIRLHAQGQSPYRCPHCGKILVRRRDLERHMKSRHLDTEKMKCAEIQSPEVETTKVEEAEDVELRMQ